MSEEFDDLLPHGLSIVDTGYVRPGLAASYVMAQRGRAAVIETGTSRSVPAVLAALDERSIGRDQVDYVIVTHVHLDHAGGAGALLRHLPAAQLVVHPRGARHMIDPSRLIAGATAVYGKAAVQALYGDIAPVPEDRVVEAPDGAEILLADRPLRFLDTPGHARHHFCVVDTSSGGVFTGDLMGLGYRELCGPNERLLFPTTTPVQFEPDAMRASIDRVLAERPNWLYLTHFGPLRNDPTCVDVLRKLVDTWTEGARSLAARIEPGPMRHAALVQTLRDGLTERLRAIGCPLTSAELDPILAMDLELNAQGLEIWLERDQRG